MTKNSLYKPAQTVCPVVVSGCLPGSLGCSAGFGPHHPVAFSHHSVSCLLVSLALASPEAVFLFLPNALQPFLNFQCCSFPHAVFFALSAGTNLSKACFFFLCPSVSFLPALCQGTHQKGAHGIPHLQLSWPLWCNEASPSYFREVQPQGCCLHGEPWYIGAASAAVWPHCALLLHARLVRKSLWLGFSTCQLCSSSGLWLLPSG